MKRADVFFELDPPPGGLLQLRKRMRPGRKIFLLAPAFAAACAMMFLLWQPRKAAPSNEPLSLLPGQEAAAMRLASENPNVIIYRVSVMAP